MSLVTEEKKGFGNFFKNLFSKKKYSSRTRMNHTTGEPLFENPTNVIARINKTKKNQMMTNAEINAMSKVHYNAQRSHINYGSHPLYGESETDPIIYAQLALHPNSGKSVPSRSNGTVYSTIVHASNKVKQTRLNRRGAVSKKKKEGNNRGVIERSKEFIPGSRMLRYGGNITGGARKKTRKHKKESRNKSISRSRKSRK